jgi:hypothetical protein
VAVAAAVTAPSSESAAKNAGEKLGGANARAFVPSRLAYRFGWRNSASRVDKKGPRRGAGAESRQRYREACGILGRANDARVAKLSQQQKAMLVGTRRRDSSLPGG